MNDKAILDNLTEKIKARVPGFKIRFKDEVWHQKLLGFLLFFNRDREGKPAYMTRFTTTLFGKVYFPSRAGVEKDPRGTWRVLAHEYVHLLDAQDRGWWFSFSYLLPQVKAIGALLAFGAFWNLWFLFALLFLGAALPWGSKYRTKWEMRGYAMSLATYFWAYGRLSEGLKEHIGSNFWGSSYYYMCRDKGAVRARLLAIEAAVKAKATTTVTHALVVADVKAVLRNHGALKSEPAGA